MCILSIFHSLSAPASTAGTKKIDTKMRSNLSPPSHRVSCLFATSVEPAQPQAFAGWPVDKVLLADPSKTSKRRLKGSNTTAPDGGLRRFFRWSDNGKVSKKETSDSKWQGKPQWTRLTEWMMAEDSVEEETT